MPSREATYPPGISVFKSKSSRKFNKILKADPACCVIQTKAGNWKVLRGQFRELLTLAAFVRVAERVAKVRDGFHVVIESNGFSAQRVGAVVGPKIWTNAQLIEQHAIYATEGKTLTLEERQRAAASAYGLQVVFGRAE
jgi:hypothetical protein